MGIRRFFQKLPGSLLRFAAKSGMVTIISIYDLKFHYLSVSECKGAPFSVSERGIAPTVILEHKNQPGI